MHYGLERGRQAAKRGRICRDRRGLRQSFGRIVPVIVQIINPCGPDYDQLKIMNPVRGQRILAGYWSRRTEA